MFITNRPTHCFNTALESAGFTEAIPRPAFDSTQGNAEKFSFLESHRVESRVFLGLIFLPKLFQAIPSGKPVHTRRLQLVIPGLEISVKVALIAMVLASL